MFVYIYRAYWGRSEYIFEPSAVEIVSDTNSCLDDTAPISCMKQFLQTDLQHMGIK